MDFHNVLVFLCYWPKLMNFIMVVFGCFTNVFLININLCDHFILANFLFTISKLTSFLLLGSQDH